MKLILADDSVPYKTFYRTENDEPLYHAEQIAYSKFNGNSTIIIHKIPSGQGIKIKPEQSTGSIFGARFTEMAQLKFRTLHSDEITFNGTLVKADDFFTKAGLGFYGRDRIWTGPDGREYRWKMGDSKPELYLNDEEKTLVAKFHREHSGFLGIHEKCPPSLEIFGEVTEQLVDMIVWTFIYMERTREEREDAVDDMNNAQLKSSIKTSLKG